ncbi:MAG: MurR/RpiR family transcriptional regulator [Spirochaetaceae bacterium]|nr:MurR/RpiR family transcriptional regulator [Spirochaetaceae bacterium]
MPDDPFNFAQVVESEIQLLKSAVSTIDRESLMGAVDAILKAKTVYIFGNGGNECLANHLAFRLARFKLKVVQQSVSGKNLFEKLLRIDKNDLIVDFHFYKSTIDFRRLMDVSEDKGIPVLLITDSILPPLIKKAKIVLHAERGPAGTFHSQVVPIAVNNAIIDGVASELGNKAVLALSELSQMRKKFYYSDFADQSVMGDI